MTKNMNILSISFAVDTCFLNLCFPMDHGKWNIRFTQTQVHENRTKQNNVNNIGADRESQAVVI